jgi:hypothetical protein
MRILNQTILCTLGLALITAACYAQAQTATPNSTGEFFRKAAGDWIGVCEQTTDGKKAENKYFHATIKQLSANSFRGQFEYYRIDSKTGRPLPAGQSIFMITIGPDGSAKCKITGQGSVMIDKDTAKPQKHELSETIICTSNGLKGTGSGTVNVSGMPLGLGKSGKIKSDVSYWTLNNDVLSLTQSIKVGFRALVFNKSFQMDARYTARRGTDVASLMSNVYAMPTGGGSKR